MSRARTFRSLALLLAFVLGGVATPLAHQVDHLFEERLPVQYGTEAAFVQGKSATLHDCQLCDVRLHAASWADSPLGGSLLVSVSAFTATVAVLPEPARAFDGRAPPFVS